MNNIDAPAVEKPAAAEPKVQKEEEPAATQQEPAEKTVEIKVRIRNMLFKLQNLRKWNKINKP